MNDTNIQQAIAKTEIIDVINCFLFSVDTRNYEAMRSCLTEQVDFDYSALFNTSMPPIADQLVEEVRRNHQGLRGLQHITTNHYVTLDGDTAQCQANFQAQHLLPNDRGSNLWTLGGRYLYSLVRDDTGWKICGCIISVAWTDGNLQVFDLAHAQNSLSEN